MQCACRPCKCSFWHLHIVWATKNIEVIDRGLKKKLTGEERHDGVGGNISETAQVRRNVPFAISALCGATKNIEVIDRGLKRNGVEGNENISQVAPAVS